MIFVESAGMTDVGRKRKGNEDSFYLDDALSLYIVADGMGGHLAGEVASRLVVDTMQDYIKRMGEDTDAEKLEDADTALSQSANHLLASIHLANQGVYKVSTGNNAYQGMGSTASAIFFTEDTLIAANVGDSPIYLIQNGNIETISVPHTVLAEQQAIDPDGAKQLGKEFRHMLTQGMGIKETVEPDICEIQCFKGDSLVICSDGLSDKVAPREILGVVSEERPLKACRTLIQMANERGGDDNITVIVIKIKKIFSYTGILGSLMRIPGIIKRFFL